VKAEPRVVLDSSALLALINGEPGAERVRPVLDGAALSTVNLCEVAGKLVDRGMPPHRVRRGLLNLPVRIYAFGDRAGFAVADLRAALPQHVSLGDRACLALAAHLGAEALTADQEWATLGITQPRVRLIR
jgi:ribonuclease VapC